MRSHTFGHNAALLLFVTACAVDNEPARVLDVDASAPRTDQDDAVMAEDDESPRPAADDGDEEPATPSEDASVSDAPQPSDAGVVADAAALDSGEVPDSGLTAIEKLEREIARIYALRCPDQPADVMMARPVGRQIEAAPPAQNTPTRPQLSAAEVELQYSIRSTLAAGGVYMASYSGGASASDDESSGSTSEAGPADAGADAGVTNTPIIPLGERTVEYAAVDDWYPLDEIEDVNKIVPGLVVDPSRDDAYATIQSAINDAVVVAGCPRVFIKVVPGTYREKVIVPAKTSAPPLTLYSVESDASRTAVVWGDSTAGALVDGTPLSIHNSATFSQSLPRGFQARNLTIANDYVEGTFEGDDQAAAALMNQGDQAQYDNVRILGNRNTLYVKSTGTNEVSRSYFRNCYIEGDEDYILGRGAAVFDQCEFHSVGDRVPTGAVTAASTRVDNPHGILIVNSEFSADAIVSDVYLGRQWFEGETEQAVGKVIITNSILGFHIRQDTPWAAVERTTPRAVSPQPTVLYTSEDYYPPGAGLSPTEVYLGEFGNSGPGAAPAAP